MTKPRKLRLLIIDDELRPSLAGYMIPDLLEHWSPGEGLPGITSWQSAIRFWKTFQGGELPDIVVADVRFVNDDTSPLSMLFQYPEVNNIPTGLSHLKSFAVLSRALGTPLGVGIRTMDPSLWRNQIESSKPEQRAMGYLAAHEAGEIASILGDDFPDDEFDARSHLDFCLEWLRNKSATVFELGLKMALRDYRRRLFHLLTTPDTSNVFLRPGHYAELMGWRQQMESDPKPLDGANDFGIELTYYNGRRDLISIASLFADFDWIATRALGQPAFVSRSQDCSESWKLDDTGRPRIGAFMTSLGSLKAALDDAVEALREYQIGYPLPDTYHPPTLASIKRRSKYASLVAGLTVLLQYIRIAQKKEAEWEDRYAVYAWEPEKLQFISDPPSPELSLARVLQDLTALICNTVTPGEEFIIDEVFENNFEASRRVFREVLVYLNSDQRPEIKGGNWIKIRPDRSEQNNEWVKWHFERLVDARVLEHRMVDGEDYYVLRTDWRSHNLHYSRMPAPPSFPAVVSAKERLQISSGKKSPWPEYPTAVQWLKASLGYNCLTDYNSVERELGAAFGFLAREKEGCTDQEKSAIKAKAGRAILKDLEKGELPFFLADVCREYATKYLKWPREKWPRWLRD